MPNRRAMDKMMSDIGRLLESQEFDSIDEVNAYLQQVMASGQPIPSAAPRTPLEEAQERMYEAFEASGRRLSWQPCTSVLKAGQNRAKSEHSYYHSAPS